MFLLALAYVCNRCTETATAVYLLWWCLVTYLNGDVVIVAAAAATVACRSRSSVVLPKALWHVHKHQETLTFYVLQFTMAAAAAAGAAVCRRNSCAVLPKAL
jgi:hypothetical protein